VIRSKTLAIRITLFAAGLAVGAVLYGAAVMVLGIFILSYAVTNGFFLVVAVWIPVAVIFFRDSRTWPRPKRVNVAMFMLGVVTFSLLGAVSVLFDSPQTLLFWPRGRPSRRPRPPSSSTPATARWPT
jgi:hypothetical protein